MSNNSKINNVLINSFAGKVGYQILVDSFYNGDSSNDIKTGMYNYYGIPNKRVDWGSEPKTFSVGNFYGGDLAGVIKKLDYLADLGIEFIYFNPIYVSKSNHKYDIQNHEYIDPFIGVIKNRHNDSYQKIVTDKENLEASNELLAILVQEAHKRGIKVILDCVLNHCSSSHKWLNRDNIYNKNEEKHHYFKWDDNDNYVSWWGMPTLPKLCYEGNDELVNEITEVSTKWLKEPYCVDGLRLDVGADLGFSEEFNHYFWGNFNKAVKEINPEAIVISEHYGDASKWLNNSEWDTVMNYDAGMQPISWFFTGVDKHSETSRPDLLGNADHFEYEFNNAMSKMPLHSQLTGMTQLSNHDHSRFMTRTNKQTGRLHTRGSKSAEEGINKAIFREGMVALFSLPGCPTIYYGDEIGMTGWTDPHNRKSMEWDNQDTEMLFFHKEIIKIRKQHQALKLGSTHFLYKHNFNKCLAYARCYNYDKFLISFNNDNKTHTYKIKVDSIGIVENTKLKVLITTDEKGYTLGGKSLPVVNGHVEITLPPYSSIVMKN